jgi:hypothetical protein
MIKICHGCPSHSNDPKKCCNEYSDPRSQCPIGMIKHVLFYESIDNHWTVLPGGVSWIEMFKISQLREAWINDRV